MVNALLAKELYILDHLTDMQSNNYVIGKFSKVSNNKKKKWNFIVMQRHLLKKGRMLPNDGEMSQRGHQRVKRVIFSKIVFSNYKVHSNDMKL